MELYGMNRIIEILEINIDLIESKEMKLLVGDMESSFFTLNGCVDHDFTLGNDKRFYKCYGSVVVYLNCLRTMGIITNQQSEKMERVLEQLEELRQTNKRHHEKRNKQSKEHDYNYCPYCGREF
jgi:hypothetical protein